MMRASTTRLCLEELSSRDVPAVYDLGAAADFNLFAFNNVDAFTSDVEGRVAVGHDASFYAYGIGEKLPNSNGTRDDLIVGHDLRYQYGQVFNGNIVYGNDEHLDSIGIPNGTDRKQSGVVDFAAAEADLKHTSAVLGAEGPNGHTTMRYGNLLLRGTHPELDIFTVTPDQLANAHSIRVIVPNNSTVLINVPGDSASIQNLGLRLRGIGGSHLLWNFYEANTLNISGVGLQGSFLAPDASLEFNNGVIKGTVVVDAMHGNGQLNLAPSGVRITIPDYATLEGTVFVDVDGDNLRGDPAVETGLGGVDVLLTGIDSLGRNISRDVLSQIDGEFDFVSLWPGTYNVRVIPPQKYNMSTQLGIPGTVNGTPQGVGLVNEVSLVPLQAGEHGLDYLLPLIPNPR
jgi:choice-of-anchor A domain-containing protein